MIISSKTWNHHVYHLIFEFYLCIHDYFEKAHKNEFLQTLNTKKLKSLKYSSLKLKKIQIGNSKKFEFHDTVFESSRVSSFGFKLEKARLKTQKIQVYFELYYFNLSYAFAYIAT